MELSVLSRDTTAKIRQRAQKATWDTSRALSLTRYRYRQASVVEPTLEDPVCQVVTAGQFDSPLYDEWCERMAEDKVLHRKQWEFVYILEVLRQAGCLREGATGLGFGVGAEPLPAVFATYGCEVVATDISLDEQAATGWVDPASKKDDMERLSRPGICSDEVLRDHVSFQTMDMRAIDPAHHGGYDFVWSACSLEHLGSIEAGADFIQESLRCLKPGGIAVHTTEYNLTSDWWTMNSGPVVLYRRSDIQRILRRAAAVARPAAFNDYVAGNGEGRGTLDHVIDVPPYTGDVHLKISLQSFVTTSIGMIFRLP